jgi:hypothetical protein
VVLGVVNLEAVILQFLTAILILYIFLNFDKC